MAILTLTLHAGDIKKAVKADTYITGQIDKSADMVKNAALAYNEQAGDDSYHEVKLYRTMKGAVGKFEANMAEYVDPGSGATGVADTLTSDNEGSFTVTIPVGNRFYAAFATTLSTLAQEYIINMMLYAWWQSIKPALAKDYYQFAQESLEMVRKTLAKTPPEASLANYTDVSGEVVNPALPSFALNTDEITFNAIGETSEFTYSLGTRDIDDILVSSTNTSVASVAKDEDTKTIVITAVEAGQANIIATSEGCPQITKNILVSVEP